jgi:hypothetical protein
MKDIVWVWSLTCLVIDALQLHIEGYVLIRG